MRLLLNIIWGHNHQFDVTYELRPKFGTWRRDILKSGGPLSVLQWQPHDPLNTTLVIPNFLRYSYGCFLKWWYPQNTPKGYFLVGKKTPWVCWGNPPFKETTIWVFPKIGVPQNGWFIMEIPVKMDDLGVPLFSETPISQKYHAFEKLIQQISEEPSLITGSGAAFLPWPAQPVHP